MMTSSSERGAIVRGEAHTSLPSFTFPNFTIRTRNRIQVISLHQINMSSSNAKKANLSATRKDRIKLPNYDSDSVGKAYHISEFLSHPSGIQAMLNTSALQSFQFIDTNTYRCTLPKVQFLNFEAAPVMDLRVTPTNKDCTVQLLSCKFEGSDIVERQNDHFSAFMINHMTWDTNDSDSFLEVDVKLNLSLEIYTRPFSLLPISAVERPGKLMMQALVDRLVPLLLQQLLQDYERWVHQISEI
ncbi:(RAP Annotation release2) Galactose-binding like domain containing protein [Melia azedarach]|uniref:(RAP Annotation release2) Galactose-binding like domain containing protein n=1 Tax=Melia azedarach TaxID=155640 RepID=A0ACC1X9E9_MELAZ|nr:(RAP Annotation release2) Galactose-binding like domain containing protein [Melia azedarach]